MENKFSIFFLLFIIFSTYRSTCAKTILKQKAPNFDDYRISLKNYDIEDSNPQEFSQQGFIPGMSNVTFSITDIPKNVAFIIFQIHAFQRNVTISYSEKFLLHTKDSVTGSNIGLFYETNGNSSINTYVMNGNNDSVDALFVVLSYTSDAPIPGGCNMEFNVEISPFQKVFVSNSMIFVDAQPSSKPGKQKVACDKNLVQHDAYHLYLPGQDFSNETYFSFIRKFLTPENILKNGVKIPESMIGSSMRRVYNAYPGVGSVYAMIATYKNHSSAYVPSFTYACDDVDFENCGFMLTNGVSKTLCVLMIFLGIYLMLFGHKTPTGALFIIASLQGGLIGYTIAIKAGTHSESNTMWIAIGSGLLFAIIWNVLSRCLCGRASRIFSSVFLAFFFSCLIYYKLPDKALPFENDYYFWAFFSAFTLLLFIVISITACLSSVFCYSIIGSYLFIVAIDFYIGSSFKYIIINFIRRVTISGFDVAIINPPFGSQEISLTVFWVIFALASFLIQVQVCCRLCCRSNRGYDEISIPVAHRTSDGNVEFLPWRDNFRAHRSLRKMYS